MSGRISKFGYEVVHVSGMDIGTTYPYFNSFGEVGYLNWKEKNDCSHGNLSGFIGHNMCDYCKAFGILSRLDCLAVWKKN